MGLLLVFAYTVQTASGFGAGLIILTLGAHLLPMPVLLALMLPLSVLQSGFVVARHPGDVDVQLVLRRVVPLMALGAAIGFGINHVAGEAPLLVTTLGVLIVLLALRELVLLITRRPSPVASLWSSRLAIFGAGVLQGLSGTGGPPLVYALGREGLDKARFRATILAVFVVMNLALITAFALDGRYDAERLGQLARLVIALPVGIVLGERLYGLFDERTFRIGVFTLLLAGGVSLLLRQSPG